MPMLIEVTVEKLEGWWEGWEGGGLSVAETLIDFAISST